LEVATAAETGQRGGYLCVYGGVAILFHVFKEFLKISTRRAAGKEKG
jgi:hypothetical protein